MSVKRYLKENHVGRLDGSRYRGMNEAHGWIQGIGYTGEKGYEIFISNQRKSLLWSSLVAAVLLYRIRARDTLRLEKGYLLSGQDFAWSEINEDSSFTVIHGRQMFRLVYTRA